MYIHLLFLFILDVWFLVSAVAVVYQRDSFEWPNGFLSSKLSSSVAMVKCFFLIDFSVFEWKGFMFALICHSFSLSCTRAHVCMHAQTHTHRSVFPFLFTTKSPRAMSPSQVAHSPCFPTLLLWVLLTFKSLPFDLFVISTLIYQILNVFSLFTNPWQGFHGGNFFRTIVIWILSPYSPCSFFFGSL